MKIRASGGKDKVTDGFARDEKGRSAEARGMVFLDMDKGSMRKETQVRCVQGGPREKCVYYCIQH